MRLKQTCQFAIVFFLMPVVFATIAQSASKRADQKSGAQVQVPNRPTSPLFNSTQGKQRTEIHFDPATGMVTLKLLVQDPNGYFIPNIRRDNFVVYENGVRQNNAAVEVEHPSVSLALVLEYGGHYPALNKAIVTDIAIAGRQLLEVTGREDKIAIWKYADRPEPLTDFTQDHDKLNDLLFTLQPPAVSETNLNDALVTVFGRIQGVKGRKAIVLISSGIDTFSKATHEDVLKAARGANTPVYAVSLGEILRTNVELTGTVTPSAR